MRAHRHDYPTVRPNLLPVSTATSTMYCKVTAPVFALLAALSCNAQSEFPGAGELAAQLAAMENQTGRCLVTKFEVSTLPLVANGEESGVQSAAPIEHIEYDWSSADPLLFTSRTNLLHPDKPSTSVSFWNGNELRTRSADQKAMKVEASPAVVRDLDCIFVFNCCRGPSLANRIMPLSELFRHQPDVSPLLKGDDLFYSFRQGGGLTTVEVAVRASNPVLVNSITVESRDAPAADPSHRIRYSVEEWADFDGVVLPRVAYRDVWTFAQPALSIRAPHGTFQRMVLRRHSARLRPADECQFDLEPHLEETIVDVRSKLVYKLGEAEINLDGHRFSIRPLADILDPASLTVLAPLADEQKDQPPSNETPGSPGTRRLLIGTLAFGMTTSFLIAWRHRRERKKSWTAIACALALSVIACSFMFAGDDAPAPSKSALSPTILEGALSHDFGDIMFRPPRVDASHVFRVTNVTDEPVTVEEVRTSCGCTAATISKRLLNPGESADLPVTLSFSQPGRRSESVWLALNESRMARLTIAGAAVAPNAAWCTHKSVHLGDGKPHAVTVIYTNEADEPAPPVPIVSAPLDVHVEIGEWVLVHASDRESARKARWHLPLTITGSRPVRFDDRIEFTLPSHPPMSIYLSGWPWRE
ncbi:MAG: DUF1573 domain-containing protein [Acidobacteriales bacterium]|nr:DUF1573 domain-containing protein [Terriglobales bacterium]